MFYVPKLEEDISDVVRKHPLKQRGSKSLGSVNSATIDSDDYLQSADVSVCFEFFVLLFYLNKEETG